MAYNQSPTAVTRWQEHLDRLDGSEVTFHTNDARTLAYRLREALAAARANGIAPYDTLEYAFRVAGPGTLIASPKERVVVHATSHDVPGREFKEAVSEFDVISEMMREKGIDRAVFPLFNGNMDRVTAWAEKAGYQIVDDSPLTLENDAN